MLGSAADAMRANFLSCCTRSCTLRRVLMAIRLTSPACSNHGGRRCCTGQAKKALARKKAAAAAKKGASSAAAAAAAREAKERAKKGKKKDTSHFNQARPRPCRGYGSRNESFAQGLLLSSRLVLLRGDMTSVVSAVLLTGVGLSWPVHAKCAPQLDLTALLA